MKYIPALLLLGLGLLIYFELDISLKQSGLMAKYMQPLYSQNVAPLFTPSIGSLKEEDLMPQPLEENSSSSSSMADSTESFGRLPNGVNTQEDMVARVRGVIDGDTIDVLLGGEVHRVRYIGVNTPDEGEPCYREATEANRAMVLDKVVTLYSDETDKDRYGRLLRYVYIEDMLVERELVAKGFAEVVLYRSDDDHYDELRELELMAAGHNLGCHATGVFDDGSTIR